MLATEAVIALLEPRLSGFIWGVGAGGAAAMVIVLFDSPPAHIERWRAGAKGERATARSLRPLTASGWRLINDVATGHGNIDHLLVGPPGVFLLETKNLGGKASVEQGVLSVRWFEDESDGYECRGLARRVRGAAAQLNERLRREGFVEWVQPVVVLWASFEQRSLESDRVEWICGKDLASELERRTAKLSEQRISQIAAALDAWQAPQ